MMSSQSLITASAAPSMPLRRAMPALLTRIETGPTCSAIAFGDRDAILALGDVERETLGLAAGIADFLRRLGRRLLVDVEQHDLRALAGIAGRDRAPDAGACAGDDGDVVLEKGHGWFPLLVLVCESVNCRIDAACPGLDPGGGPEFCVTKARRAGGCYRRIAARPAAQAESRGCDGAGTSAPSGPRSTPAARRKAPRRSGMPRMYFLSCRHSAAARRSRRAESRRCWDCRSAAGARCRSGPAPKSRIPTPAATPAHSHSFGGGARMKGEALNRMVYRPASDAMPSISISIFGSGSACTTQVVRAG